jgi:two-component system, chemotaxis family, chemotaxis protein CheY
MNSLSRFILIDDDEINNMISSVTIKKMAKSAYIQSFLNPFDGFEHIVTEYSNPDQDFTAILFLDLSMPGMDGWEFLERFEKLHPSIRNRITVYVLSSSEDNRDINRAKQNKNISQYVSKPLTTETVRLATYTSVHH